MENEADTAHAGGETHRIFNPKGSLRLVAPNYNPELKAFVHPFQSQLPNDPTNVYSFVRVSGIPSTGAGDIVRNGDEVYLEKLRVRLSLLFGYAEADQHDRSATVRLMIYSIDHGLLPETPSVVLDDYLQDTGPLLPYMAYTGYSTRNAGSYRILYDEFFAINDLQKLSGSETNVCRVNRDIQVVPDKRLRFHPSDPSLDSQRIYVGFFQGDSMKTIGVRGVSFLTYRDAL